MTKEELNTIIDKGNFYPSSDNVYDMQIIDVLKKQVPQKPIDNEKYQRFDCPCCHDVVIHYYIGKPHRCICGQALDWSGIE